MKFEVDWSQPSTLRGACLLSGGVIAMLFLIFSGVDKAMAAMAIAAAASGGIGVAVKEEVVKQR